MQSAAAETNYNDHDDDSVEEMAQHLISLTSQLWSDASDSQDGATANNSLTIEAVEVIHSGPPARWGSSLNPYLRTLRIEHTAVSTFCGYCCQTEHIQMQPAYVTMEPYAGRYLARRSSNCAWCLHDGLERGDLGQGALFLPNIPWVSLEKIEQAGAKFVKAAKAALPPAPKEVKNDDIVDLLPPISVTAGTQAHTLLSERRAGQRQRYLHDRRTLRYSRSSLEPPWNDSVISQPPPADPNDSFLDNADPEATAMTVASHIEDHGISYVIYYRCHLTAAENNYHHDDIKEVAQHLNSAGHQDFSCTHS